MAYQSLYRKYRPQTFDDIVGQDPVVRTLVNAITEDRLHHAYLFAGPRGTGKTSTARILAKAINCEQGPTAEPCGTCQLCVDIATGSAVDVIELDMASHGSVDDARELRERALFAPAQARRKVYILDEVHMASTQAFNALLKLIEEPPAHVLFTMATTDPQKVLTTILSRVQRLDLRRVGAADVAGHVRRIADAEGRELDDAAVDAVVRAGDGSVRDTMSILEQVLAYGSGTITGEQVAEVLGTTPAEVTHRAAQHVIDQDVAGALSLVQELLDGGKDLRRFALDLVGHLRDLLVLQVAPDRPDLVDATDAQRQRVADQAPLIARETLIRALDLLAEALPEMRQGSPRLPLELALSRAALPETAGDVGALADRVARLEAGGAAGAVTVAPSATDTSASVEDPSPPASRERKPRPAPAAEAADRSGADTHADADTEVVPTTDQEPAAGATDVVDEDMGQGETPAGAPDDDAGDDAGDEPSGSDDTGASVPTGDVEDDVTLPDDGGGDPLATIQSRWAAILERIRERSRRAEAIFGVATPVALEDGRLTLGFSPQHENFHAKQAPAGDLARTALDAIEQVTSHRPTGLAATIVEGGGPGGAEAPTASADTATEVAADEEELAVAEAEAEAAIQPEPEDDGQAAKRAEDLLTRELDAEPVD